MHSIKNLAAQVIRDFVSSSMAVVQVYFDLIPVDNDYIMCSMTLVFSSFAIVFTKTPILDIATIAECPIASISS